MRWFTYPVLTVASGLVAASGCRGDEESGAGGATTTASNTTGSSSTTSDSTTTTTTNTCGVDLVEELGSTADCSNCLAEHCCTEAQDFLANPDIDGQSALEACAVGTPACRLSCTYSICTHVDLQVEVLVTLFSDCAACLGAECCDEVAACVLDAGCQSCSLGESDAATCCAKPKYLQAEACETTRCSEECASRMKVECGAGGSGGSAGVSGGGGAGGA